MIYGAGDHKQNQARFDLQELRDRPHPPATSKPRFLKSIMVLAIASPYNLVKTPPGQGMEVYTVVLRQSTGYWVALCLENGLVGQGEIRMGRSPSLNTELGD